jgi:glycosyltransferase involved in cell wall biosynthesis
MRAIRVLHVLGSTGQEATGMVRVVSGLVAQMPVREVQQTVAFLDHPGPLSTRLQQSETTVATLGRPQGIRHAWKLIQLIQQTSQDIVHFHVGGLHLIRTIRAWSGVRTIRQVHGTVNEANGRSAIIRGNNGISGWIAVSENTRRHIETDRPCRVIYPGVGWVENGKRPPPDRFVIGALGRLVGVKNFSLLIEAFERVAAQYPDVELEIVGDGPLKTSLVDQSARGLHGERIRLPGWQEDPSRYFQRWHLFVMPSREEAFGLALVEAMQAGLPVVTSDAGALPELVTNGSEGLHFRSGDAVSLATTIVALRRDQKQRERLALQGQAKARRLFNPQRMAEETRSFYEGLLASHERSHV